MQMVCACGSRRLKLMWEYHGSGLWCLDCGVLVRPEDLPLPARLRSRLVGWNRNCAAIGRREMNGECVNMAAWQELQSEGRALCFDLNRYAPTYLYHKLGAVGGRRVRCPDCTRFVRLLGRRDGYVWGICEECTYWVVGFDRSQRRRA